MPTQLKQKQSNWAEIRASVRCEPTWLGFYLSIFEECHEPVATKKGESNPVLTAGDANQRDVTTISTIHGRSFGYERPTNLEISLLEIHLREMQVL